MGKRLRVNCTSQEEWDLLDGIKQEFRNHKVNSKDVKHGWIKNKKSSIFFKNPDYKEKQEKELDLIRKELIEMIKSEIPNKKISSNRVKGKHLLLIDPADVHIGKLASSFETGKDYNQQIAVNRVLEGVGGIIDNSSGWDKEEILFVIGNDILHTDTPKRTTTSGTPQDTDGMWYENFMTAIRLYQNVISELSEICQVRVVFNPSNHDYTNGFFLAQLIEAYFSNDERVSFDCSISHRKYYKYYTNLIGTTHGDGAKWGDLGMIMAHESSKYWSSCEHRYWYLHHVHHKTGKDLIGCTVEALRSPSEADSWHHRNGYVGSVKAIEGYIHHRKYGQISRLTHCF